MIDFDSHKIDIEQCVSTFSRSTLQKAHVFPFAREINMDKPVGQGAFATVHKAFMKKDQAVVAVKVLKQPPSEPQLFKEYLKVRHPLLS